MHLTEQQRQLFDKMNESCSISDWQEYFKRVLEIRGFEGEGVMRKMLLLTEEVGELAKAIRKEEKLMRVDYDRIDNYDTVKSEIADVLIVLISICNECEINICEALQEKERINVQREWGSSK